MKISDEGLALIKSCEKLYLNAYLCPAGYWTIGWGHLITQKDIYLKKKKITLLEAQALLQQDIVTAEQDVLRCIKIPLMQHQFDACTSFVFNLGVEAFKDSTLCKMINGDV